MQIFSALEGLLILVGYAVFSSIIVWIFSRGFVFSKSSFLVAGRNIPKIPAAVSIAAAWIWAPALFVSAEKSYTQGWVGLFWFLVPNVGCLVLFSFFAKRLRTLFPDGITMSGYMRERFSRRVQRVYLVAFGGLAACSFAVQLLAGGKIISTMSGLPYFYVTVLLAIIPVGYSLYSGLRASIISDFLMMMVMLVIGVSIVGWAVSVGGGPEIVLKGVNGKSGTYDSLFSGDGLNVFYTFGIPVTIGLLSGPFGDQSFWQRAYAVKKESVQSAFLLAAILFAVVPFSISILGFLAAGGGMKINNPAQVNIEVVLGILPGWVAVPFLYLLLAGLVSTLDSNLASLSSLFGHDLLSITKPNKHEQKDVAHYSKGSMVALVVVGIAIANIPGLTILYLFLFYGTLRASTLLPTIITLLSKEVNEAGMFWGILISLSFGLPTFAYGNLNKVTPAIIGGSLFTVLASGIIVLLASRKRIRSS
ncbi:MAG: hypothetical protein KBC83_02310 [Candidatus Moranbacteria bacterium]|nr:hypothetical protein [Candidatus Moranbacteria bacterium]MBP9801480.1 hypothetical protein [Candidatus Moranbacteria bacterium]